MKTFRRIFLIFGILLIVVIAVLLALFFILTNPDHLKTQITQQVYAQTGLKLQINGEIHWAVAEELGLRFTDVELKQPVPGDINSSAKSPQVEVFISWRPLLSRQIKIQKLFLHQCSLLITPKFSKKPVNVNVKGDLQLDLPTQHLSMEHLTIDSGNLHLSGKISGEKILQNPELQGELKLFHLNLADGLQFFPQLTEWQGSLKNVVVHMHFSRAQWLSGDIVAEELTFDRFHVNHFAAEFTGNPLQIQLRKIRGVLAGGALMGTAIITQWTEWPHYRINAALTHTEISKLLKSDILQGPGDLSVHLTLAAAAKTAILSSLNGTVQLSMAKGVLNHIDLLKQIRAVREFLQANPDIIAADVTHFSRLTASGNISNGLFTNHDFMLQSPDLQAKGNGTVNLLDQQLKYYLIVNAQGKIAKESYALALPLKITGTLAKPKVKIDFSGMSVSGQLGKTLHNEIKNLFGHHSH